MRERAGCIDVFVSRWVLGSWKRGRKISSGSSECFPSTSGPAWLRGFASVPRDFSNSSNDLPERELKGMTRVSEICSQGSEEKSQCNLVLAGGEMPTVTSWASNCPGQPSLLQWDGDSHRYKSFWLEVEGMCAYVCTQLLLNIWIRPRKLTGLGAGGRESESSTPILCFWDLFPPTGRQNVYVKCGASDKGISP